MRNYLKTYPARHTLSVSLTVLTAVIVNYFYSYSHEGWIILTAFLVSQTTRGTPLKQSFIYFFFILLIAMLMPVEDKLLMQYRVIDGIIGGLIGIIFSQYVFPVKVFPEFSLGIVPILQSLQDYSTTYANFLRHAKIKRQLSEKKWKIEEALSARQSLYPEWVYEVGFNPGLRAGYRFFLINLERVTEIFFSMNYLADGGFEASLIVEIEQYIKETIAKNNELLQVLIEYFNEDKLMSAHSKADYTSDMAELEKVLNRVVPANLDWLDVSSEYVALTALVRDLKDLRGLLLQLVMALPAPNA